ncbi:hypothetical protein [Nocardioides antri]|uniref:LPXTG cell wall anchor domain-containing protein n=1 Tax=Nocardioides antri TaxID=2607659 RepID=A0A5B1M2V1_9ACTN|nr:hypothetical protein [Nocardioides antri]KAA1427545.1 hypothetical protein F0U47_08785 [Nocardioides antri]
MRSIRHLLAVVLTALAASITVFTGGVAATADVRGDGASPDGDTAVVEPAERADDSASDRNVLLAIAGGSGVVILGALVVGAARVRRASGTL